MSVTDSHNGYVHIFSAEAVMFSWTPMYIFAPFPLKKQLGTVCLLGPQSIHHVSLVVNVILTHYTDVMTRVQH